jgi:hypothetical protein
MPPSNFDIEKLLEQAAEENKLPRADVCAKVRSECTKGLKCKTPLSWGKRLTLCGVLMLVLLTSVLLLASGRLGYAYAYSAVWGVLGWAVVLLALLAVGFSPKLANFRLWRIMIVIGLPVMFYLYIAYNSSTLSSLAAFLGSPTHCTRAAQCGVSASILGAVGALGLMFMLRGSDPYCPRLSGAVLGLMGGVLGALSTGIVCPGQAVWHTVLGHGLSLVAVTLVGAGVGRRILAP